MWKFSIRSTERARYVTGAESTAHNPHLRSGVLAVQLAVSEAILSHVGGDTPKYEVFLDISILFNIVFFCYVLVN